MSRAQDRSSDLPQGVPAGRGTSGSGTTGTPGTTGTTGTTGGAGTTAGAAATGVTGDTMTTAGTGVQERQSTTSAYARGTGTGAEYRPGSAPSADYQTGTGDGLLGGTFMVIAGLLTFFTGLAGVVKTHYFHAVTGYAYAWSAHSWSWAILILGAVLLAVGACAMLGMSWAKPVGIFLAVLTIIAGFMFLVYAPLWGVILLAVSVLAIWGLLRHQSA